MEKTLLESFNNIVFQGPPGTGKTYKAKLLAAEIKAMYAYRIIQPLNGLHVQFDLPSEFAGCQEAEIIVLPVKPAISNQQSWEQWVLSMAGILSNDFPDDITDDDLGVDIPRDSLE